MRRVDLASSSCALCCTCAMAFTRYGVYTVYQNVHTALQVAAVYGAGGAGAGEYSFQLKPFAIKNIL